MFAKEKSNGASEKSGSSATLISAGTVLQGDVKSETDLRIDGTIQGNVYSSAKIVIGPTGHVEGNIEGRHADITGRVTGNITVEELLQLRGQCHVEGNIQATTLQIDPTATFNGKCQMGTRSGTVATIPIHEPVAEAQ